MQPLYRSLIALGVLGLLAIGVTPILSTLFMQDVQQNTQLHIGEINPDTRTIVVDLRDDVTAADVAAVGKLVGAPLIPNSVAFAEDKVARLDVPKGANPQDILDRLRADNRVEVAEEEIHYGIPETNAERAARLPIGFFVRDSHDFFSDRQDTFSATRPNDPLYDKQWNFQMVGAEQAWERSTGKGIVVAVIDTGVAAGKSRRGKACKDFAGTHLSAGYDFIHDDADAYDDNGHGTHVAGTVAETTNNKVGLAGLAYDATIMPLKVLTKEGWGNSEDIADAIRWAADHGANVINMSLGSTMPSEVIHKAVKYAHKKGVVIVCAAGNGFGEPVGYPAAFPECIAVSSVGPTGDLAFYSSYGKEVALAAPGGDKQEGEDGGIWQNTVWTEDQGGKGDDYYAFQGTSMASPHVAAVAALVMAQGVTDPARVRDLLTKTATPNGEPNKFGAGILSAEKATARASGLTGLKHRDLLLWGLTALLAFSGLRDRRRNMGIRLLMAGALGVGFFGPDWFADRVGADSPWNLLGFSLIVPLLAYLFAPLSGTGRIGMMKTASALAIGVGVCIAANIHNGTVPFTAATYGDSADLWTAFNLVGAFVVGLAAAIEARPRNE